MSGLFPLELSFPLWPSFHDRLHVLVSQGKGYTDPLKFMLIAPKCKWIPPTKLPWIPCTYECQVNFVGIFVVSRIPQQANIASYFGFRNSMWILQNVSGFRILFNAELAYEQLKARAGILISSNAEFKSKDLIIVSGIHEQVLNHWLPKSVDVIF